MVDFDYTTALYCDEFHDFSSVLFFFIFFVSVNLFLRQQFGDFLMSVSDIRVPYMRQLYHYL